MHGSSAVPQEWLAVINEHGGEIPETYGVPVEQVVEGIKHGVRKVNIDTDLRAASTGAIRRFLAENPAEFDPRKYFKESLIAMRDICSARFEAFGLQVMRRRLRRCHFRKCKSDTATAVCEFQARAMRGLITMLCCEAA